MSEIVSGKSRGAKSPPATPKGGGGLPCLNSNNSTDILPEAIQDGLARLSTQHKKSAFVLGNSVRELAAKHGIERIGFLTLTFRDHVVDPKEASRRFDSLNTHVLSSRYGGHIRVYERQKSGRIHYHLLVVLDSDIRTGADFTEFENGVYSSASPALRSEWAFWRKTAPLYGFGRTELLPVKSSDQAIGRYMGKYIAKHMDARQARDKGVRLVSYSGGTRSGSTRFQFLSEGSAQWRAKVALVAECTAIATGQPVTDLSHLSAIWGKRWAYRERDRILNINLSDRDRYLSGARLLAPPPS